MYRQHFPLTLRPCHPLHACTPRHRNHTGTETDVVAAQGVQREGPITALQRSGHGLLLRLRLVVVVAPLVLLMDEPSPAA